MPEASSDFCFYVVIQVPYSFDGYEMTSISEA